MASTKIEKIDPQILNEALESLENWSRVEERDAIEAQFIFKNFAQSWSFMCLIAKHAEDIDHHPEWFNVYNRVDITLTTHDAGGISVRDIEMAKTINAFASQIA